MEKTYDQPTYVICHGTPNVLHFSKVEAGTSLYTGQPLVEEFTNGQEWRDRVTELGGDVGDPDITIEEPTPVVTGSKKKVKITPAVAHQDEGFTGFEDPEPPAPIAP